MSPLNPLVSVIVPVFNVVDYLDRCVNSLCCQTWPNLEILLIDDGSTDGSGFLCDEFALKDTRIRVVHQPNAGLSAARNAGLDLATGEYLAFVDSDDWVHPRYIEALLSVLIDTSSQMAICNWAHGPHKSDDAIVPAGDVEIIDKEEAIPRMLKGEWVSAWAKLCHRSLFDGLRFPLGKNNEDYAILIYLFERCNTICLLQDVFYYYFIREGSITRSPLNAHSFDELDNGMDVWSHCRQKNTEWGNLALFNLTASIIKLSGECLLQRCCFEKYNQMRRFVSDHKRLIFRNPALSLKYHPFLWALLIGPVVHLPLVRAYYKR